MDKQILHSSSPEETQAIAEKFAAILVNNDFVALYGDLGAGKTAFTRGLASYLVPGEYVSSPTYAIVNEYEAEGVRLCHFDMYRITSEDDLCSIGFYDYTDCITVCEWCENIEYALPRHYYKVTIEKFSDDNSRTITIEERNDI